MRDFRAFRKHLEDTPFHGVARAANPWYTEKAGLSGTVAGLKKELAIALGLEPGYHAHWDAEGLEACPEPIPAEIQFRARGLCRITECTFSQHDKATMTITWRPDEGEGVSYSLSNKISWCMHPDEWSFVVEAETDSEFLGRVSRSLPSAEDRERLEELTGSI